jgi:signal transduction histidine kinase
VTAYDTRAAWAQTEAQLAAAALPDDTLWQQIEALRLDDPARMLRALQAALARPALQADPAVHAHLLLMQGLTLANLRHLPQALESLDRAKALEAQAGGHRLGQRVDEARPWLLIWQGDFGQAANLLRARFDQALRSGDCVVLVRALEGLAMVASCTGRHARADELHRQAGLAMQASSTPITPTLHLTHAHNHCVTLILAAIDAWLAGQQQALQQRLRALAAPLAHAGRLATEAGSEFVGTAQRSLAALQAVLAQPALQQPDPRFAGGAMAGQPGSEYGHLAEAVKARRRDDHQAALLHARLALASTDPTEFPLQLALRREISQAHAALGELQQAWHWAQQADVVTARRDNEQATGQLDAALDAVQRERGLAAALIGHDLRSPITAIRALARLPQAASEDEAARTLGEIEQLAGRALDYADEFLHGLQLQRLDPARFAGVAVPALVAGAVEEVRHAGGAAAQVQMQVQAGLVVRGDAQVLHRMLVNLMLNALQAAREHGLPQCLVVSGQQGADGAVLAVRDQGPGIPDESLRGLFDSTPADPGRRRGFGLGLRYVARCARAMGGVVLAMNHAGGGATVAMSLPLPGSHLGP